MKSNRNQGVFGRTVIVSALATSWSGMNLTAQVETVDLRTHSEPARYSLLFSARRASVADLSPGHAFVVWFEESEERQASLRHAYGMYPRADGAETLRKAALGYAVGNVPGALLTFLPYVAGGVPGEVRRETVSGDPDLQLVVRVNEAAYKRSLAALAHWQSSDYELLASDCVTFTHAVAASIGLKVPQMTGGGRDLTNWFPQAYVDELISLNTESAIPRRLVILLIDSSGSMSQHDPQNLRRTTASMLADHLSQTVALAMIDFDDTARVVETQPSMRGHESIKAAIDRVDASGGTDIGGALRAASRFLAGQPHEQKAIVLFTDGRDEDPTSIARHVEEISKAGWPVFSIGLSTDADDQLLASIAAQTGGAYFQAWEASDLSELFEFVAFELSGAAVTSAYRGDIREGDTYVHSFIVDDALQSLRTSLSWPGSDLDLVLIAPDGRRFSGAESGVRKTRAATYEIVEVDTPAPGKWKAEIRAIETAGSEPFSVRTGGESHFGIGLDVEGGRAFEVGMTPVLTLTASNPPLWYEATLDLLVRDARGDTVFDDQVAIEGPGSRVQLPLLLTEPGQLDIAARFSASSETDVLFTRELRQTFRIERATLARVTWVEGGYLRVNWVAPRVEPGRTLDILDRTGEVVGKARILTVHEGFSEAEITAAWGGGPRVGFRARASRR